MSAFTNSTLAAGSLLLMITGSGALAQTETTPAMTEPVGLSQAVQAAEEAVQGRAFEVEFESEDGRLVYELELLDGNDDVHEVVVDAGTGEVIGQDEQTVEGLWQRWLNSDELAAVTGAERSLSDIITAVEAETGASVREASIDTEGDRVVYEMELAGAGGDELEVEVDPATGEILKREADD